MAHWYVARTFFVSFLTNGLAVGIADVVDGFTWQIGMLLALFLSLF